MSDEPTPSDSNVSAKTDGDHKYKSVQHTLKTVSMLLDAAGGDLQGLLLSVRNNGERSNRAARNLKDGDVDPKFLNMQNQVSLALGAASVEAGRTNALAADVTQRAEEARRTHARLYDGLDRVRQRKEATPKPGWLSQKGG